MAHTKGPWRIGDAGNTVFGPPCGLPPQRIADLSGTKGMHANGRLIAAAPELLDALEMMVERATMRYPHFESGEGFTIFNLAKAAILKATGKEEK